MGKGEARGNLWSQAALSGDNCLKSARSIMSTTSHTAAQHHSFDEVPTQDTDIPATAHVDHMGRKQCATVGEAFAQDWPYILGLILLMGFVIGALGGYFR